MQQRQLFHQVRDALLDQVQSQGSSGHPFYCVPRGAHLGFGFGGGLAAAQAHAKELVAPRNPRDFQVAHPGQADRGFFASPQSLAHQRHLGHGLGENRGAQIRLRRPGSFLDSLGDTQGDGVDIF